jgi:hypothetical protein
MNGFVGGTITIPEDISDGFHTLHMYGINVAGEPIDIYRVVYIADGGIDTCGFLGPIGQDVDKDSVDDSCDGQITEPPIEVIPAPPNEQLPPVEKEVDPIPLPVTNNQDDQTSTSPQEATTPQVSIETMALPSTTTPQASNAEEIASNILSTPTDETVFVSDDTPAIDSKVLGVTNQPSVIQNTKFPTQSKIEQRSKLVLISVLCGVIIPMLIALKLYIFNRGKS